MRVFLDTNVLVSAFTTRGMCADLFRDVLDGHDLLISDRVLEELERVLTERFEVPADVVRDTLNLLRGHHVHATPQEPLGPAVRDPDDVWILSAAIDARADVLVTGDKDLLAVAARSPIRIVNPRGFLEMT